MVASFAPQNAPTEFDTRIFGQLPFYPAPLPKPLERSELRADWTDHRRHSHCIPRDEIQLPPGLAPERSHFVEKSGHHSWQDPFWVLLSRRVVVGTTEKRTRGHPGSIRPHASHLLDGAFQRRRIGFARCVTAGERSQPSQCNFCGLLCQSEDRKYRVCQIFQFDSASADI